MKQRLLRIKDWKRCFETRASRGEGNQEGCHIPNKQDGQGYRYLLARPDGEAMYGAFHALILLLSKHEDRDGWITENGSEKGKVLSTMAIANATGFSMVTVDSMLDVVINEIGWIEEPNRESDLMAVSYPNSRPTEYLVEAVKRYHDEQTIKFPYHLGLKKHKRPVTEKRSLQELQKFLGDRDDSGNLLWTEKVISDTLDFALSSPFWCTHMTVLTGVRNPGKEGNYKLATIRSQMDLANNVKMMTGEELEMDMHKNNLPQSAYESYYNNKTSETLWRRIS